MAELYLATNTIDTNIASASTPVPIGNGQGATHPAAVLAALSQHFALGTTGATADMEEQTLVYTGATTGFFRVAFNGNILRFDGAGSDAFEISVFHKGVVLPNSKARIVTGTNAISINTAVVVQLETNDTLQMMISNESDGDDALIGFFQLHVHPI